MRAVIQRVTRASVTVAGDPVGTIGPGLLVLLAVEARDGRSEVDYFRRKLPNLRIFNDEQGRMDLSLRQVGGDLLIVSQFTLYGDCRRGNRPSYSVAAPPQQARQLYRALKEALRKESVDVASGRFGAQMQVSLVNDGPVTLILDSPRPGD